MKTRFKELRETIPDKYGDAIGIKPLAQKIIDAGYIDEYEHSVDATRQAIARTEEKDDIDLKIPYYLIEGYCKYFQISSDYLLGFTDSQKPYYKGKKETLSRLLVDSYGLSDESLDKLCNMSEDERIILNAFIESDSIDNLLKIVKIRNNFFIGKLHELLKNDIPKDKIFDIPNHIEQGMLLDMFKYFIRNKRLENYFRKKREEETMQELLPKKKPTTTKKKGK